MITGASMNDIIGPQALDSFIPLVLYIFGIALYGIVIWHSYRFIATRDIFHSEFKKGRNCQENLYNFFEGGIYFFKYLFFFPLITFISFAVLATFLIFLSKSPNTESILLVAMSIVAATRITAYYNEDLSKDLAKMLPFAILGVFLINPTSFSLQVAMGQFQTVPEHVNTIIQFGLFTILLEFGLRLGFSAVRFFIPENETSNKKRR